MIYQKSTEEKALLKELKKNHLPHEKGREKIAKLSMGNLYAPLKVTINLHNLSKLPNFKTTWTFNIVMEEEIKTIIQDGIFFEKNEVKSVYLNNILYKKWQN